MDFEKNKKIEKRRIENLLPAIFQTDINKKFFDASVNHLYQKQETEELLNFVGKIIPDYDYNRDFYLKERNIRRRQYQLSSLMISTNLKTKNIEKTLFYDDLINYLRFKGGLINNHQRLFSEKYYSWCPPIDIDKFVNYKEYYWVPYGPAPIELNSLTDLDSVIGKKEFSIFENGKEIKFSSGLRIRPTNDINNFYNNKIFIIEGVGRYIYLVEDSLILKGWDLNPWDLTLWDELNDISIVPEYIVMERGSGDNNYWSRTNRWFHVDVITNFSDPTLLKYRAVRPIIEFQRDIELYNFGLYDRGEVDLIIENCPQFYNIVNGRQPGMPTGPVDPEVNLPSIGCNLYVNEINNNWPLSNYGYSQIFYIDNKNNITFQLRDGLKILLIDDLNPNAKNKIFKITGIKDFNKIILQILNNGINSNGDPSYGERIFLKDNNGKKIPYWYNDEKWIRGQIKERINQEPLFNLYDIDKIFIGDDTVYPENDFKGNKIFSYKKNENFSVDNVLGFNVERNEFNEFVFENNLIVDKYSFVDSVTKDRKDIKGYYLFKINDHLTGIEIYDNAWHEIPNESYQFYRMTFEDNQGQTEFYLDLKPIEPVFNRDDTEKNSLIVKINSKELKNGIDYVYDNFNVKIVLNKPLKEGEILEILIIGDNVSTPTRLNGEYEIPINLFSNPDNDEITYVSMNQLFDHFYAIIKNQKDFHGNLFSRNNFRDTAKEKYLGNKILQHESPMLRLMLLASDKDLDLINSIKYVQKEYNRFYVKFINILNRIYLNNNNPDEWIEEILKEINVGKNNEFPFKNSGMISPNEQLFIPPTPSFLGITQTYKPEIYTDDTFINSVETLKCHDGSIIPLYGDFRDQVLLRLEEKIYEGIDTKFKNQYLPLLSKYDVIPGKFRKTDYSRDEINKILQPFFELWLYENNLNFEKNEYQEKGNEKLINYTNIKDYEGETLFGSWRSLFMWYYDTDTPHLTPWEMLGFSEKPDWWENEYGAPPYTSNNYFMWKDLSEGYIRNGPRKGKDKRFERKDLLKIIPVDQYGMLKTPKEIGLIKEIPDVKTASKNWEFGEWGPVETVWRKSREYNYVLAILLFLTKPAKFVEYNWDNQAIDYIYLDNNNNRKQLIHRTDFKRGQNKYQVIHDEPEKNIEIYANSNNYKSFNGYVRRLGIQQFISNYLLSRGIDIETKFADYVRGLGVSLGNKMAGFIDSENFVVESESFGKIPNENVKTILYKGNYIKETVYSGVIVERVKNGYKIYGYDLINPYFNIIRSDYSGKKIKIGLGKKKINYKEWQENTTYFSGDIVLYNGEFYKSRIDHQSDNFFDITKWIKTNNLDDFEIVVFKYLDPIVGEKTEKIKYGTFFSNIQEVFNFLTEYERYLKKEGFVFDQFDELNNEIIDFTYSGKEFLLWSYGKPKEGEIIALSPLASKVKFKSEFGVIEPIEEMIQGVYSILNRNGEKILPFETAVTRIDDFVEVVPVNENDLNKLIYALRLYISEYEHCLIFDNKTIFNDVLYDPLFSIKVDRLRLKGKRTKYWNGKLEAYGFIIYDTKLIPNYDNIVDMSRYFYDNNYSENIPKLLYDYSNHLIGYKTRDYMTRLTISEKTQFNFYQGMIRQKGTENSLSKLLRSEYITNVSDMIFYEEWLFRIGDYGTKNKYLYIKNFIDRSFYRQNPQIIRYPLIDIEKIDFIEISDDFPVIPQKILFYNTSENKLYKYNENSNSYENYSFERLSRELLEEISVRNDLIDINVFIYKNKIIGTSYNLINKPVNLESIDKWLFSYRKSEFGNEYELPNAGYVKMDEFTHVVFNKNKLKILYENLKLNNKAFRDGDRLWMLDTSLLLGSKFNQPLNNFYDSWSLFRITKYDRKIEEIRRDENNKTYILFKYKDVYERNKEDEYILSVSKTKEDNILVSIDNPETVNVVENDNIKITGPVYNLSLSAINLLSGQTLIISYNDDQYPESLDIVEFFEISSQSEYVTLYDHTNGTVEYSNDITEISATYIGNNVNFDVFLSTIPLTGESIWVSYSLIVDFEEVGRTYTEKFISDGVSNTITLSYYPNSNIKVRKGTSTILSAEEYFVENNPYFTVSSNTIIDYISINYENNGENYEEIFEFSGGLYKFRPTYKPENYEIRAGTSRKTYVLYPYEEFIVSAFNKLKLKVSSLSIINNNSKIYVEYLYKDLYRNTIPSELTTINSSISIYNLNSYTELDDVLIIKDRNILYNNEHYTVSSGKIYFNNPLSSSSTLLVYYLSKNNDYFTEIESIVSSKSEITLSSNNIISTNNLLINVDNVYFKSREDYIVSANKIKFNSLLPLNKKILIRNINNWPGLNKNDLILFDNLKSSERILIEGFHEIIDKNERDEILIDIKTDDSTIIFSDDQDKDLISTYVLRELRFTDINDLLS